MQSLLLYLFLILTVVSTSVFIYVYRSSIKAGDKDGGLTNVLTKRMWFILILFVVLAIFFSATVPKSPYFMFKDEIPSKSVNVTAGQYFFYMSYSAINPDAPTSEPIELGVNELVEFRVTSRDVTHTFAVYDENNQVVAQTQAMPGYVNNLRWKFEKPGTYKIFCLEYCGAGHHIMRGSFTVK
ncbi:MAG: hypothetical protein J5I52_11225 [Saprospiraceae bacterium]|nr:MAG: nitrous oxide reductase apoprotein [Bacteroidetes bacterium OLB9]MCO6464706.1 hypothetical protein [Saprospiraceae bacterium]MCZ2339636.1 hypothetical protein [Chitinophagales bacterium]